MPAPSSSINLSERKTTQVSTKGRKSPFNGKTRLVSSEKKSLVLLKKLSRHREKGGECRKKGSQDGLKDEY